MQSLPSSRPSPRKRPIGLKRVVALILLALWLSFLVLVGANRTAIDDWLRLRGYTAPAQVADLAIADTMTQSAKHLFYLNRPQIITGTAFAKVCPTQEQTIVIGCYHGGQNGIFILSVSDPKLSGIEQVTAAHEMLHAAYERLSSADKQRVNAILLDYYQHGLTDERVKKTIATYQRIEPGDVTNEMHSIFGTEVAQLPPDLETYYQRYFSNRAAVTAFTASYQSEFTSREQAVAAYDAQLASMKQTIDSSKADLSARLATINSTKAQLDTQRNAGDTKAYNRGVPAYNDLVDTYNTEAAQTKQLIVQYNQLVIKRNAIALEEQQLVQEISGSTPPIDQ